MPDINDTPKRFLFLIISDSTRLCILRSVKEVERCEISYFQRNMMTFVIDQQHCENLIIAIDRLFFSPAEAKKFYQLTCFEQGDANIYDVPISYETLHLRVTGKPLTTKASHLDRKPDLVLAN